MANKEDAKIAAPTHTKPTLRRSSTSCLAPNQVLAPSVTNGNTTMPEVSSKQSTPAVRLQRSASMGRLVDADGTPVLKRKRETSPKVDLESIPNVKTEVPDTVEETSQSGPGGTDVGPLVKRRRSMKSDSDMLNDAYCWVCHKELVTGQPMNNCEACPRSYHPRCAALEQVPGASQTEQPSNSEHWACPECRSIDRAENVLYRSHAMQLLTLDQLCTLLKFSLARMKAVQGVEPFSRPVDPTEFPQYRDYIVNPMDLSQMERNLRRKQYGSTEAFLADAKWLLHNSAIFNTCEHPILVGTGKSFVQAKLTSAARSLVKVCRQEMVEIENCPDCYLNAHTRKESWFIEVCRRPHMLVWAKLKGFPFWPAKAMKVNKEGAVDVRFFGAHDRAWVPMRDCFLYSREMPAPVKPRKRNNLESCVEEVEQHALRLKERFGAFTHAPLRTPFDPDRQEQQLHLLLPNYHPGVDGKRARTILHPEIAFLHRSLGKSSPQGSSMKDSSPSEKQPEKFGKTSPTSTRASRSSSTPKQYKNLNPVVIIKKHEDCNSRSESAEPEQDSTIEDDEDDEDEEIETDYIKKLKEKEETQSNSSFEDKTEEVVVQVEETDKKLDEERTISAIIKASKDMEETLVQTLTSDKTSEDNKSCDGVENESAENDSDDEVSSIIATSNKQTHNFELEDIVAESPDSSLNLRLHLSISPELTKTSPREQSTPINSKVKSPENTSVKQVLSIDDIGQSSNLSLLDENERISPVTISKKTTSNLIPLTFPDSVKIGKVPSLSKEVSKIVDSDDPKQDLPCDEVFKQITVNIEASKLGEFSSNSGVTISAVSKSQMSVTNVEVKPPIIEVNISPVTNLTKDKENNQSKFKVLLDKEEPKEDNDSTEESTLPHATEKNHVGSEAIEVVPLKKQSTKEILVNETGNSETVSDELDKIDDLAIPESKVNFSDKTKSKVNSFIVAADKIDSEIFSSEYSKSGKALSLESINPNDPNKLKILSALSLKKKSVERSCSSSDRSSDSESDSNKSISKHKIKKRKVIESTEKKVVAKSLSTSTSEEAMDTDKSENQHSAVNSPAHPSSTADDDTIFPSLFLDPSVTITIVENDRKSSTPTESADLSTKDLCSSVNLSSDVSLTVVESSKNKINISEKTTPSSSPAPSSTAEVSSTSKKPLPPLKGKSKARKSFAPSKQQLISVKNPLSLLANGTKSPTAIESQSLGRSGPSIQKDLLVTAIPGSRISQVGSSQLGPSQSSLSGHTSNHPQISHSQSHGLLPLLQPRPFTGNILPGAPSNAGPATAELNKHSQKLTEFVRQSLEALISDLSNLGGPEASVAALQLELERMQWRHQQELSELKHNADLVLLEMRSSLESERVRVLAEARRQSELERQRAVEETKKKQWCAYCSKEALFYCCWNTSYCDYPCQQAHWPRHMATCAQKYSNSSKEGGSSNNPSSSNATKVFHSTTEASLDRTLGQEPDDDSVQQANTKVKSSKWSGKRKRCGRCQGCLITENCGICRPCKNSRTHQVCRERRCLTLEESEQQQRFSSPQLSSQEHNKAKKNQQGKGLPPNVPLTTQQLVSLNASGSPSMAGSRGPPQHYTIVPRPMQVLQGGGMPPFAMFPGGNAQRQAPGGQTTHVAFPIQPHFYM